MPANLKRALGAALLAALVTAGCGGGGDEASSSSDKSSSSRKSSSSDESSAGTQSGKAFTAALCRELDDLADPLRELEARIGEITEAADARGGGITDEEIADLRSLYATFTNAAGDMSSAVEDEAPPDVANGDTVKKDVVEHLEAVRDAGTTAALGLDGLTSADATEAADAIRGFGVDFQAAFQDLDDDFTNTALDAETDASCQQVFENLTAAAQGL